MTWYTTIWTRARAAHYNYGCNSHECCWGGSSFDDDLPCYCRSCLCNNVEGPEGTGEPCPCEIPPPACPPVCCVGNRTGIPTHWGFTLVANHYFGCGCYDTVAQCGEACFPYVDQDKCFGDRAKCVLCELCQGPGPYNVPTYGKTKVQGPFEAGFPRDENCEYITCCDGCDLSCSDSPVCEGGRGCVCENLELRGPTVGAFLATTTLVPPPDGCFVNVETQCYQQCDQDPCGPCSFISTCQCDIPRLPASNSNQNTQRFPKATAPLRTRTPQFNIARSVKQAMSRMPKLSRIPFTEKPKTVVNTVSGTLNSAAPDENLYEKNHMGKYVLNTDYLDSLNPGDKVVHSRLRNQQDTASVTNYIEKHADDSVSSKSLSTVLEDLSYTQQRQRVLAREHNKLMRRDAEYRRAYSTIEGCEPGLIPGNRVWRQTMGGYSDSDYNIDPELEGSFAIYDPRGVCVTPEQADCPSAQVLTISASVGNGRLYQGARCWEPPDEQYGACGWSCDMEIQGEYRNTKNGCRHSEYYYNFSDDPQAPPDMRSFAYWGYGAGDPDDCGPTGFPGGGTYCSDPEASGPFTCSTEPTFGPPVLVHARHWYYSAADLLLVGNQYGAGGSQAMTGFPSSIPAQC
jgi:hypothetical protein